MGDKEQVYSEELRRCRENIAKTKKLIEYHKDMLKRMERKESEIISKLDAFKLRDLRELISKGGYDIDALREAMKTGDLSGVTPQIPDEKPEEESNSATSENVSEEENTVKIIGEDTSPDNPNSSKMDVKKSDIERKDDK